MRITKISVKGLFGMFDHEIPLNQDSRITIVHGPNGVGKTILFGMIHALFQYGGGLFVTTPFERFRVEFESGAAISIKKEAGDYYLFIEFTEDDTVKPGQHFVASLPEPDELEEIETPNHWYNLLRPQMRPEWFKNICETTSTELIHTLRLRSDLFDVYGLHTTKIEDLDIVGDDFKPAAVDISERFVDDVFSNNELAHMLEFWYTLAESARAESENIKDFEDGILEYNEELRSLIVERQHHLNSVHQYIVDYGGETDNARELMLFVDIINERCLFKSLIIRDATFMFISDDGNEVPISALSSGEQQLLVLYYQLLFEIEPDTLVMIDEPELSMNVVWQRNFLKDLKRIIELRKFDVLIATHSPEVIYDKWDWTVALGAKADD